MFYTYKLLTKKCHIKFNLASEVYLTNLLNHIKSLQSKGFYLKCFQKNIRIFYLHEDARDIAVKLGNCWKKECWHSNKIDTVRIWTRLMHLVLFLFRDEKKENNANKIIHLGWNIKVLNTLRKEWQSEIFGKFLPFNSITVWVT